MHKLFALLSYICLILGFMNSHGQCAGALISYFPAISGGITISQTYTGDVYYAGSGNTWSDCGVTSGPMTLGGSVLTGSPFTQTLTFSSPVNNIVYVITAPDSTSYACETFTFSVDSGTLSCVQGGSSCPLSQSGNVLHANSVNTNGTYITLSSSLAYTSITVSGTGGANGTCMAICSSSVTSIKDENTTDYSKIYPNPADKVLNIECRIKNAELKLITLTGAIVKEENMLDGGLILDMSGIKSGMYFVYLKTIEGIVKEKIIVHH